MAVSFDDLIPDPNTQTGTINFDDLVPSTQDSSTFNNTTGVSEATRLAAMGGSNLVKGFGQTLGIPGSVANLYDKYLGKPFAQLITGQTPQYGLSNLVSPNSNDTTKALTDLGLVDRPDLQPQNTAEKYYSSAMRGIGAAGPLAPLVGTPMAAAQVLAQGAGGGMGEQAAQDFFPGNPSASLIGSLLGGGVASGGMSAGERGVNSLLGNSSPILQAYETAGITPRLAGDVSGSSLMQKIQSVGGNKGAAQESLNEFGNSVENLANSIGQSQTLQEAGTALQNDGQKWLDNFKTQSSQLHGVLNDAVGSDTPVVLNNTAATINNLQKVAGNNSAASDFLSSPLMKQFSSIIDNTQGGSIPWETSRALKTRVGEYLENPSLISDAGAAQAKQLYGALSQDQQAAITPQALEQHYQNQWANAGLSTAQAKQQLNNANNAMTQIQARTVNSSVYAPNANDIRAVQKTVDDAQNQLQSAQTNQQNLLTALNQKRVQNPTAQQLFQQANAYTRAGHDFIDSTLNKIMNASTPEQAARNTLSGGAFGGTQLQTLRQQMPDATNELAAVSLRRAMSGESQGNLGNAVSPSRWLSNQDPTRRLSSEAFNALYPDPEVQNKMSALDMVADNMRGTEKLANRSNTALHVGPYAAALGAIEGARAGHEMGGLPGAVAGAFAGGGLPFALSPVASGISSSPSIARFMGTPATQAPFSIAPSMLPAIGNQ